MDTNQVKALRLIASGGAGLTERAVVIIGQHAPAFLSLGLIVHSPKKKAAYSLTKKGREALASADRG